MNITRRILGRYYDTPGVKFTFELLFVILPIAFIIRTFVFGLYQVPTGSMEHTLLVGERFIADKCTYWLRAPHKGEIIAFNAPDKKASPQQGYAYSTNPLANLFERYVWGPENWTKRVIGTPNDHVQGKIENGKAVVYLNGTRLEEPYVNQYPLLYVQRGAAHSVSNDVDAVPKTVDLDKLGTAQPFYTIDLAKVILNATGQPYIVYPGTPIDQDVFDVTLGKDQYWVMGDNRLGSGDSRMWGILEGNQIHARIVFRLYSIDSDETWWPLDLLKHPIDFGKKYVGAAVCNGFHNYSTLFMLGYN